MALPMPEMNAANVTEDGQLCRFCGSAEFEQLLNGFRSTFCRVDLVDLIRDTHDCAGCRELAGTLPFFYSPHFFEGGEKRVPVMMIRATSCRSQHGHSQYGHWPMPEDLGAAIQIEISIRSASRQDLAKATLPCDDIPLQPWRGSSKTLDVVLDVVPHGGAQIRDDSVWTWMRDPMSPIFEASKLRRWINACDESHPNRSATNTPRKLENLVQDRRFRLLDVTTGFLETVSAVPRYFALSYVWGAAMANYMATMPHIPHPQGTGAQVTVNIEQLPATIRDVARLVKSLRERYLWVDALCIDQSQDRDKECNIEAMSAIYAKAYVAADGYDAGSGLQRLREYSPDGLADKFTLGSGKSYSLARAPAIVFSSVSKSWWRSRAWTFQEEILSQRCVYFTRADVFFQCRSERLCKQYHPKPCNLLRSNALDSVPVVSVTDSNYPTVVGEKVPKNQAFSAWATRFEAYTRRSLTDSGDRLDAFSAVYYDMRMGTATDEQIALECGIPMDFMYEGLLWTHLHIPPQGPDRLEANTRGTRRFPSWSWIGWNGSAGISDHEEQNPEMAWMAFKMIDPYNIWAFPARKHIYFEAWQDPPQPSLCEGLNEYTVHIKTQVIRMTISFEPRPDRLLPIVGKVFRRDGGELGSIVSSQFRLRMPRPGTDEHTYEAMLLRPTGPMVDGKVAQEVDAMGLLILEVDGHDQRVGLWSCHKLCFNHILKTCGYSKHVKLR